MKFVNLVVQECPWLSISLFSAMTEDNNEQPSGGEITGDYHLKVALLMNLRKQPEESSQGTKIG